MLTLQLDMFQCGGHGAAQRPENADNDKSVKCLCLGILSEDLSKQYECCVAVRKLISNGKCPPIQQVIEGGVLGKLILILKQTAKTQVFKRLQMESAWILTNISSGTLAQTRAVVRADAINVLVPLLSSNYAPLREQAAWALGNIAGDCSAWRDIAIKAGMVSPLVQLAHLSKPKPRSQVSASDIRRLRVIIWSISNVCRGQPSPRYDHISVAVPQLCRVLELVDDSEVLSHTCWSLSHIAESHYAAMDLSVSVVRRLVYLLRSKMSAKHRDDRFIAMGALRTLGNLARGNEQQTQRVLNAGLMPCLSLLIKQLNPPFPHSLRGEAYWMVSNIAAGNAVQKQSVIDVELVPLLMREIENGQTVTIRKEASMSICHLVTEASPQQLRCLYDHNVIGALCGCLGLTVDSRVVVDALDACLYLLSSTAFDNATLVRDAMEMTGVVDLLEALQLHPFEDIYNSTVHLLTTFFDGELVNNTEAKDAQDKIVLHEVIKSKL